jgi:phospholipid/cholesterol/gamma-HCH transport system substrate-binding protein
MSQAVRVGIFATLALVLLGYFVLRIEDLNLFQPDGRRIDALFDSVAGLDDRSSVRVAGVRVGRVDGISLDGSRARVHLLLDQPVDLTEDAYARIANLGLLGDKYVEVVPGDAPQPLADGVTIRGETPPGFDDAMAKLNEVADSIVGFTDPLGASITGEGQETSLSRLIANLEATSAEIRLLVEANRVQLSGTIRNFEQVSATLAAELPKLTMQLQGLLGEVQAVVAENRGAVNRSTDNVAEITDELKTSVDDLNLISGKLARGEGTIGKLINSEEAHDELVATLDSIQGGVDQLSDTLGRVGRLRLDVDMQGWVLADVEEDADSGYGSFGLTLVPHEESKRLYRVGIAQSPSGDERTKTQTVTVTNPDGTTETTRIETLTMEDDPLITALVGYRMDNGLRMWTGLIEEDFGVQVEYPLFDRRFWLDFQAFSFDRENDLDPHLRLIGRYYVNDNVYILGGWDDPLVDELRSPFIGGGVRWTDDDLKYLLGSVPLGGL